MTLIKTVETKKFKKREYRSYNILGDRLSRSHGNIQENQIYSIDTKLIKNWQYHDRPSSELGDINALAHNLKHTGQQTPCIIRKIDNPIYKYELIAGERRWQAAQNIGILLKCIIREISDYEAALIQISENLNRKSLSDYARGISYSRLINKRILKRSDLMRKLKISKQQMSRLLSFDKIPIQVIKAIGNMSRVSSKTAEQIKQLSNKGQSYIQAINQQAPLLASGKLSGTKLTYLVKQLINKKTVHKTQYVHTCAYNKLLFYYWYQDGFSISINFSKKISELLKSNSIYRESINQKIKQILKNIKI